MSKFKVGDTVFHIGHGVGVVIEIADETTYWNSDVVSVKFNDDWNCFTIDGRFSKIHKFPQLYTLAEARKMGFDVPKVKKSKTLWVYYNIASRNFITTVDREPDQVGYLEKEVTFEWEEEA